MKANFGEKSLKYTEALFLESLLFNCELKYEKAFDTQFKTYLILKDIYGTDENERIPPVLSRMAYIKGVMKQWEDAFDLIDKAKSIEEKVHPNIHNSPTYKELDKMEHNFKIGEMRDREKNKYSKVKIIAGVAFIGLISTGIYYWFKKEDN